MAVYRLRGGGGGLWGSGYGLRTLSTVAENGLFLRLRSLFTVYEVRSLFTVAENGLFLRLPKFFIMR